jgi:hypothetical protein
MMHVGIPWWFTYGIMQHRAVLATAYLPLHKRRSKIPILYLREKRGL